MFWGLNNDYIPPPQPVEASLRVALSLSYYRSAKREKHGITQPAQPRVIQSGGRWLTTVKSLPLRQSASAYLLANSRTFNPKEGVAFRDRIVH